MSKIADYYLPKLRTDDVNSLKTVIHEYEKTQGLSTEEAAKDCRKVWHRLNAGRTWLLKGEYYGASKEETKSIGRSDQARSATRGAGSRV